MGKIKCICNGSRGTDCDYCQGTGYISEKIKLDTTINDNRNNKYPNEIIKVIGGNTTKETNIKAQLKKPTRKRKSFDDRVYELKIAIKETKPNDSRDTISYLKSKIETLISNLKRLEKKVTSKTRRHFIKITKKSQNLLKKFEKKFEPNDKQISLNESEAKATAK